MIQGCETKYLSVVHSITFGFLGNYKVLWKRYWSRREADG